MSIDQQDTYILTMASIRMMRSNKHVDAVKARRLVVDVLAGRDELLRSKQVAEILAVRTRVLTIWRANGLGPPFVKISARSIRYSRKGLEEWIAAGLFDTTIGLEDLDGDDLAGTVEERQYEQRILRAMRGQPRR